MLLVLTGSTDWDERCRLQGAADLPLCPDGKARVDLDLRALEPCRIAQVRCAPDEASRQTAELLAAATGGRVRALDTLAEPSMGLWEGQTLADLEERFPSVFRHWRTDPNLVVPPEGESLLSAQHRITGALARAFARYAGSEEQVAVVLRPIAMALLRCALQSRPIADIWEVAETQPRIERLSVELSKLRRAPTLERAHG